MDLAKRLSGVSAQVVEHVAHDDDVNDRRVERQIMRVSTNKGGRSACSAPHERVRHPQHVAVDVEADRDASHVRQDLKQLLPCRYRHRGARIASSTASPEQSRLIHPVETLVGLGVDGVKKLVGAGHG